MLDTKCLFFFFFVADLTGQEKINMKIIEATELFIVELVKKRIKARINLFHTLVIENAANQNSYATLSHGMHWNIPQVICISRKHK